MWEAGERRRWVGVAGRRLAGTRSRLPCTAAAQQPDIQPCPCNSPQEV